MLNALAWRSRQNTIQALGRLVSCHLSWKKSLFPSFSKNPFFLLLTNPGFFSLFVQLTPSVAKNWPTCLVDLLLVYLFDCSRCSKWDWNAAICGESLTLKNPSSLIISPQIGCWKSGWKMRSMSIVMTWIVADYISIIETKISMISIAYGACIGIACSILISHWDGSHPN